MKQFILTTLTFFLCITIAYAELDSSYYHHLDAIEEFMFELSEEYPERVRIDTIGYSTQFEWPIYGMKISNDAHTDYDRPAVVFLGSLHAEEVIGIEVVLELMRNLALNPRPQYRNYRNQLEIYCVPTINPEGLSVCWGDTNICHDEADATFRKNIRDTNNNGILDYEHGAGEDYDGVDLNRNFPINWFAGDTLGQVRAVYNERYDYYRGASPGSEPEVTAIMNYCRSIKPLYSLTFHSSRTGTYTDQIMYSWHWDPGYSDRTSPDFDIIEDVAEVLANISNAVFVASAGRNGKMHDWMYAEGGWFNYQVETGPPVDIQPNQERLLVEIERQLPLCYYLLDKARRLSDTSQHLKVIVSDETGSPTAAEVLIPERHDGYLQPRLTDETFGVLRRPLPAGLHNVVTRKWGYLPDTTAVAVSPDQVTDHSVSLIPAPMHNITIGIYDGSNQSVLCSELIVHKDYGIFKSDTLQLLDVLQTRWPEGHYEIETWANGFIPRRFEFYLNEDTEITAELALIDHDYLVFDDFESDPLPDYWAWEGDTLWGRSNCDVYNGLTALESYPRWPVPKNEDLVLTYTQDIPENIESLVMTGYRCFELEPEADFCLVEVSYDGGNSWTELENLNGFERWHSFFYNLREGILDNHDSFTIRWTISTDNANVDRGLFLDDIALMASDYNYNSITENSIPTSFEVFSPYPNPFNSYVRIPFHTHQKADIQITIYDILGRKINQFVKSQPSAGEHFFLWDGSSISGNQISSGTYFINLKAGDRSSTRKILLLK